MNRIRRRDSYGVTSPNLGTVSVFFATFSFARVRMLASTQPPASENQNQLLESLVDLERTMTPVDTFRAHTQSETNSQKRLKFNVNVGSGSPRSVS